MTATHKAENESEGDRPRPSEGAPATTPPLETPRLLLRPLELADAAQIQILFPQWEIVRYLANEVPWPYPPDGAYRFLHDVALPAVERGEAWHWTLRLKTDPDNLVGSIGLMKNEDDNRGFWIASPWQGRGLMNDAADAVTISAVHGVCCGGWFELALVSDLIIADRSARFCFPELRLGLVPGFGGIPRLKRDLGNAAVRDLLFTGRSINASKALEVGLVSQVVAEGQAPRVAHLTAQQVRKFDRETARAAKRFVKPVPYAELRQEIELFCELFERPAVEEALRRFVESTNALPYLP